MGMSRRVTVVICILPIYSMTTWPSVYLDSKGTPGEAEDDKSIEKNIINKSGHDTNLNLGDNTCITFGVKHQEF